MPPGAPHHSFILPYRVRVDDFTTPRDPSFQPPALHLLSHTHSDHITGLNAKSFGARVICSIDAKHMLLNNEPAKDRIAFDKGEISEKTRPYSHLKVDPVLKGKSKWDGSHYRDLLEEACSGLVKLISLFPPLTRFFINSWTWGYEDILKAIGRAFNTKIHVDRYKHAIYDGVSDPSLNCLLTRDSASTRFHACERFNRCDQVVQGIAGVVYINPVTLSKVKWDLYFLKTSLSLQRGELVSNLLCPLSRHSSLPELQAFVKLFRPKLVVPTFLNQSLGCLDWACM
ncbi:hypothetical protein K439DRAFT_1285775, partial [Ramaria rubella]